MVLHKDDIRVLFVIPQLDESQLPVVDEVRKN